MDGHGDELDIATTLDHPAAVTPDDHIWASGMRQCLVYLLPQAYN